MNKQTSKLVIKEVNKLDKLNLLTLEYEKSIKNIQKKYNLTNTQMFNILFDDYKKNNQDKLNF